MFDWLKKWRAPKFTAGEVQQMVNSAIAAERERLLPGLAEKRRQLRDDMAASFMAGDVKVNPTETSFMRLSRLWARAPKWAVPKFNASLRVVPATTAQLIRTCNDPAADPDMQRITAIMLHTGRKAHYTMRNGRLTRFICKDK